MSISFGKAGDIGVKVNEICIYYNHLLPRIALGDICYDLDNRDCYSLLRLKRPIPRFRSIEHDKGLGKDRRVEAKAAKVGRA